MKETQLVDTILSDHNLQVLLWLSVRSRKLEIGLLFLLFVEQGAKNAREEKQLREEVYCHLFIYFSTIFPGFVYMFFLRFPEET